MNGSSLTNEQKIIKGQEKLNLTSKIAYGFGEVPGAIIGILGAFLMMFYTDKSGIEAGLIGSMFLVSKVFDGIVDIAAGIMVDKTKSKWGKARPWLLWLSVPTGLTVALIFMVPNSSQTVKLIYAFITYNLIKPQKL